MISGQKLVVVLPAYNAAQTIARTYTDIPHELVDDIILCDDASADETMKMAQVLGIKHLIRHDSNQGYGANQKSLYRAALDMGADIIIMLHPDYQYDPQLIAPMSRLLAQETFPVVLGSRILGRGALAGGMPVYKYAANRALTFIQNLLGGYKLSEYHTGYRGYRSEVLRAIPFELNSDDFTFDNQILAQIIHAGFEIGEISCPARYFPEASSINFWRSCRYGWGVIGVSVRQFLQRTGLMKFPMFKTYDLTSRSE